MRLFTFLLLTILSVSAFSQLDSPPNPIQRKVLFDGAPTDVRGLTYSATAQKYVDSPIGSQHARFVLSLITVEPPEGCNGPYFYQWEPVRPYEAGLQVPEERLIVDQPGDSASAIGTAYAPGYYSVKCTVIFRRNSDSSNVPVVYQGDVAVIGGPIYIQIVSGTLTTLTHDQGQRSAPYYIQYFGYSNYNPPTSTLMQKTQNAFANVLLQPEGTEVTWVVPSPLESPQLASGDAGYFIDIWAEGPCQAVPIGCFFDLTFVGMWGDVVSNTVLDDTTTTPQPPTSAGDRPPMMVNKISGHKPHEVVSRLQTPYIPAPAPGGASCGLYDTMQLKDHLGQLMPGMWVQERFDLNLLPPGAQINSWQQP